MENNKNILITGYSGFVGTNLVNFLKSKSYTINLLNLRNKDFKESIEGNVSTYIHLAGKAHDIKGNSDDQDYYDVNTTLTKELFNHFLNSNARNFIFLSSVKAAAESLVEILTEEYPEDPKNSYGKSKLMAEQYILSKTLPNDKRIFILRPCMIIGQGAKGNVNLLYKFIENKYPFPFGAFKNERSMLSISNFNYIIENILKDDSVSSGIYNLADDQSISTVDLVKLIAKIRNRNILIIHLPKAVVKIMAKLGDLLKLPFNSYKLNKITETYLVSNEKIKKELKINNLPNKLEDGIAETVNFYSNKSVING